MTKVLIPDEIYSMLNVETVCLQRTSLLTADNIVVEPIVSDRDFNDSGGINDSLIKQN